MHRSARLAALVVPLLVIASACSDSSPTTPGADEDDDDDIIVGEDGAGDPNAVLECERGGFPCAWSEVSAALAQRSDELGDEVMGRLESGESVAAARDWIAAQPGVAEAQASADAVRFRLAGALPVWVLSSEAILIPLTYSRIAFPNKAIASLFALTLAAHNS